MRARAEDSRDAIRQAALAIFCERGYRATTLEEIGAQVGITRGAVLHHFNSKAELLTAAVDPYVRELTELVDDAHVSDPTTAAQRRQLLTSLVHLFFERRGALQLLATDVAARVQLGLVNQWALGLNDRLVQLLLGSRAGDAGPIRVSAALGAMVQPIVSMAFELDTASARNELIEAALAVLDRPASASTPARDVSGVVTGADAQLLAWAVLK
jgi:AcrR family transcriptional regulator